MTFPPENDLLLVTAQDKPASSSEQLSAEGCRWRGPDHKIGAIRSRFRQQVVIAP
jgi:hypothetical protein